MDKTDREQDAMMTTEVKALADGKVVVTLTCGGKTISKECPTSSYTTSCGADGKTPSITCG
jgi:hypothetical protein